MRYWKQTTVNIDAIENNVFYSQNRSYLVTGERFCEIKVTSVTKVEYPGRAISWSQNFFVEKENSKDRNWGLYLGHILDMIFAFVKQTSTEIVLVSCM